MRTLRLLSLFSLTLFSAFAQLQTKIAEPHDRITAAIDEGRTMTLRGNVHPVAATATPRATAKNLPMEHMILTLSGDATQEAALQQLIAQQQDPKSALYHHYLTPAQFGAQFGPSQNDIQKIQAWLVSYGFRVDEISTGRRTITFSGTSDQVSAAFKTDIAVYAVAGSTYYANKQDPEIPVALAGVVSGVVRLHNFPHHANMSAPQPASEVAGGKAASRPEFTSEGSHYLAPADYGTIYDINPLYSDGVNGSGQSIAIIARSDIELSDVEQFRQSFGLPANNPSMVYVSTDPGVQSGDTVETTLDTEWSGAVAPNSAIKVVIGASTNSADGIDLSAQYAVNNDVAHVISLSYGSCEAAMGSGGMNFYNALWEQAAAEGITVLVSAGDSGAAGCDYGGDSSGTVAGVNGLCSSPYSTCVGGTEFADTVNPGQYWLAGNNPQDGSATSYIPEMVWNESGSNGGSGLWAGGGGASIYFQKPSWQTGPGVPADGQRDVPDVSMSASGHDGYLIVQGGALWSVGGTSAAAPSFAGLMALVGQHANSPQGDVNPLLYPMAANQANGGAAAFHDTTAGNNSVPGVTGFTAGTGYDEASGLGSVDASVLVNNWPGNAPATPSLSVTASSQSITVPVGGNVQLTVTTVASHLSAAVALSVSGAPANLTATLGSSTIAMPGSGSVALHVVAGATVAPGTYQLKITAASGTRTASVSVSVTVAAPTFTFTASSASVSATLGGQSQTAFSLAAQNGFNSAVALSLAGLPSGVTASFAPASVASGSGASTLTLKVATSAKPGTYALTITATGGKVTKTITLTLTVTVPGSCTLTANPASLSIVAGQPASAAVTCGSVQGTFTTPLTYSVAGQPSGVTASFSQSQVNAGTAATLNISANASTAVAGKFSLTITAVAGTFSRTVTLPVTLQLPTAGSLTLSPAVAGLTVKPGASGQLSLTASRTQGSTAAITTSVSGAPAGVTASVSSGTSSASASAYNVTLAAASSAKAGTYSLSVNFVTGNKTFSVPVSLTIATNPSFTFIVSTNALSIQQGGAALPLTVSDGNYSGGFNSTITLTITGLPPGMNYAFQNGTASNNFVNITYGVYASTATAPGTYPITVHATGGGNSYSATVNVTVAAATQVKH